MVLSLTDLRRRRTHERSGQKITKEQAEYKESPEPEKHSCGICTMFRAPHECTLVAGKIYRDDGCRFFEHK